MKLSRQNRRTGSVLINWILISVAFGVAAEETVAGDTASAASEEGAPASDSLSEAPDEAPAPGAGAGSETVTSVATEKSPETAEAGAEHGESPPEAVATPSTGPEEPLPEAVSVTPAAVEDATPVPEPPTPVVPTRHGPRRNLLLIGPGFGISVIYPKEINLYLDNWVSDSGARVEEGFTAMISAFQPKLAVAFAPIEYVQLQVVGEIGWAPKVLAVSGGDAEYFQFVRYTTGGTVAGNIPISNGRRSISVGVGGLFNVLKFESLKEIAPGVRGVFGFRFYGRRAFTPEIFAEFNWIRADTGADSGENDDRVISELNYTSFTIGGNFYFKVYEK